MKIGLQIPDFTWPGGPERLAPTLANVARVADEVGFDSVSVMDHLFQIPQIGPIDNDMLEAYTALGFLAAHTRRARLLTVVSAVTYRHIGVLAKTVTTLDVLSGGRAMLGIGAGWNEEEAAGLGVPFPSLATRFELLEDAVLACLSMWQPGDKPFTGRHVDLARTLNVPAPLSHPHPPIMIGGEGEKKTLRLVARYAQASNMWATPELPHKLEVLARHCENEGRNYAEIEKTANYIFEFDEHRNGVDKALKDLESLAELGIDTVVAGVPEFWRMAPLELVGREIIPVAAEFGR